MMKSGAQKVLKALWSPLALVGLLIAFGKPIWKLVEMVSDPDFLMTHANSIGDFLDTGMGTIVLVIIGFGLVFHALYKARGTGDVAEAVDTAEKPSQESGPLIRSQEPYAPPSSHAHLWPTIQPVEIFVPDIKLSVPSTDSFQQQFERYDSFTVDEAMSLLCEENPLFTPILDTFSSLSTK